jgi:glycosyltransferase involved in cell wall biosynthesis
MKEKKIKITIIGQTPPPYGGQIIHIGKIVQILAKNNFDHVLIRMNFSEEMNETGKFSVVKIVKLFMILLRILTNLLFYRPDYVYYPPSGNEKSPILRDIILLFFVRLFRFKVIFHFHAGGISDIYPRLNIAFKLLFKFVFSKPDYSICMSNKGKKDPLFVKSKEIVIIPYGVEDLTSSASKIYQKNSFQVLFVGVCRETKGILDFVKVIEKANSINKKVIGRIVGKIFSEKEERIIETGIRNGIINFEGVKIGDDKNIIFCDSDLFLFPTFFEHENFPTVNLEAFSCGLPVVSTNWRGVVDQVQDGINGFIHDVHDIEGMVDSILKIVDDKELQLKLSKNARSDYEEKYSNLLFEKNVINFFKNLK